MYEIVIQIVILYCARIILSDYSRPSVKEAAHGAITGINPSVFMLLSVCPQVCTSFVGHSFCYRNLKLSMWVSFTCCW